MKKVLLIEDDDILRENTEIFLKLKKFEVITANNGIDGVKLAINQHPDIIICDITMPRMNGYEVLTTLRKQKETSIIPFIFLTAKSEKEDYRKGLQLGVDDYISKPFSFNELLSAIELRLNKAENLLRAVAERYISYNFDQETLLKIAGSVEMSTNKVSSYASAGKTMPIPLNMEKLSSREAEILQLIASGMTTAEIAAKLFISPRTAEFHRSNLLAKTESKNTADLIRFAVRYGLVEF
ncbi:MAG TPA: response regulator transcription factor [Lentimicrobium sp.]|nr:response regulator transcription factor [Lentimicrobium sp.]